MSNSAIILAGGFSNRFGQDKGLLQLGRKPLVKHVLDAVSGIVEEELVIVSSQTQAEKYRKATGSTVRIVVDKSDLKGPLVGALTGFEGAQGQYSFLLPCDTPFISRDILQLLLELGVNKNAVIPRWPSGYIEPLQSTYRTKPAFEAASNAIRAGGVTMQDMISRLRNVRYVSTLVLEQLDPEFRTFFNVNTPMDLKKAEAGQNRLNQHR